MTGYLRGWASYEDILAVHGAVMAEEFLEAIEAHVALIAPERISLSTRWDLAMLSLEALDRRAEASGRSLSFHGPTARAA